MATCAAKGYRRKGDLSPEMMICGGGGYGKCRMRTLKRGAPVYVQEPGAVYGLPVNNLLAGPFLQDLPGPVF